MGYAQLAIAAYGAYNAYKNKPSNATSQAYNQAMAQLQGVPVPDPESLKVQMQQLVQQGLVNPQDADAVLVQHNAYDEVTGNAEGRGAQLSALQDLQDKADAGGLTDTDRAAIQANLDTVANTERGQNLAITKDAQRRGVSGSGLELAQKLMAQQAGADQAGRRGMDIAALAEQARSQAINDAANLGGQIHGQDLEQQGAKAQAANAIAQYNATNQQQVTLQNIAARNAAQAANLQEKQRIADQNTTNENTNRVRNADLLQQNYENKMDKAKGLANLAVGQGQATDSYTDRKNKQSADFNSGILKTVADYGASGGFSKLSPQSSAIKPGDTTSNSFLTNQAEERKKVLGYAHGTERVPGEAEYPGDDPRNDTVPALLSPGEKVIPRSETGDDIDSFLNDVPRTAQKPSVEAVKTLLQALTDMGC